MLFRSWIREGISLDNVDKMTEPSTLYSPLTIDTMLKKYADVYELLLKTKINSNKLQEWGFDHKIRAALDHLSYKLENDGIYFYNKKTNIITKMTKEEFRENIKKIYLLYHGIFVGFYETLKKEEIQNILIKISEENKKKDKTKLSSDSL